MRPGFVVQHAKEEEAQTKKSECDEKQQIQAPQIQEKNIVWQNKILWVQ